MQAGAQKKNVNMKNVKVWFREGIAENLFYYWKQHNTRLKIHISVV